MLYRVLLEYGLLRTIFLLSFPVCAIITFSLGRVHHHSLKSTCTRVLFLELAFMHHFLKDAASQVVDKPQWESVTLAQSMGSGPVLSRASGVPMCPVNLYDE